MFPLYDLTFILKEYERSCLQYFGRKKKNIAQDG